MKIKKHKEQKEHYGTGYEKPLTAQQKEWIIDLVQFQLYLNKKKGWNIPVEDKWLKHPSIEKYLEELNKEEDV